MPALTWGASSWRALRRRPASPESRRLGGQLLRSTLRRRLNALLSDRLPHRARRAATHTAAARVYRVDEQEEDDWHRHYGRHKDAAPVAVLHRKSYLVAEVAVEAGEGHPAEHRQWEEDVRVPEAVRVEEHHGNQPQQEAGEQVIFLFLEVAIDEAGQRHQPDEQVHGDATRAATLIEAERLVVHEDLDSPRQPEEVGADQHDQYLLEHLAPVYRVDQQAERDQVSKGQVAVEREREQKSRGDLPVSVDRHEYQRRQDQDQRGGALDGRVPEP